MVLFPAKDRESRRFRPVRRKGRRIGGKAGGQSSQGASSGRGQNPSVAVEGLRRGRSQDAGEGGTAALRLSCFPRGGIGLRPLIAGEARLLAVGIDDGRPSSRWSASGDKSWVAGIKGAACVRENKASQAKGGAPSVERDVGFRRRWGVVGLRRKRGLLACARSRSRHVAETDGRAPCCGHRSGSTRSEPLWYHSGKSAGRDTEKGAGWHGSHMAARRPRLRLLLSSRPSGPSASS